HTNPWVRKNSSDAPGFNIATLMRTKKVAGDIGIEIEVEGNKFPKHEYDGRNAVNPEFIPSQWKYHKDGSLRGNDNAEYVFAKPLKFSEVNKAIDDLWDMFEKYGSKLDDSNRTSVHVHLNAQKWHLNRICVFSAMYFSVEEILTEWCGDHRVGNLFCLRAKDAPGIISKIKRFLVQGSSLSISEGLHYAGLNVHSLCKFGSIEIRALRGCTDKSTILDWVDILQRLYENSGKYADPRTLLEGFTGEGPMAYFYMLLGNKAQMIKDTITWDNQQIMSSLYEGVRLAQDLCYCREWSEYSPVSSEPSPFERSETGQTPYMAVPAYSLEAGMLQSYYNSEAPASLPTAPPPSVSSAGDSVLVDAEWDAYLDPDYDDEDD